MTQKETFLCLNPNPARQGTRVSIIKYNLIKQAILETVAKHEDGVFFKDLAAHVANQLTFEEMEFLGSVAWYTTIVKLDLEARGFLERIPGSRPQRISLSPEAVLDTVH